MRRPSPLRRFRWQLGAVAALLALVIPAAAWLRGDHAIYQSGTVSMSHQFIAHDCAKCHDSPGQGVRRLVMFDSSASTVSEQACLVCHAGPGHHPAPIAARRCSECHREHQGAGRLSHVASGFCTECHADLPAGASFVRSINQFSTHPEFAALRPATDDSIGANHSLLRLAVKDPETGRWRDKAAIMLNHKVHLNPKGLPAKSGNPSEPITLEQLDCQSCHVPDSTSGNFQPIAFEQHCARCHAEQLSFLGMEAGLLRGVQPVPHRQPEIIRGVLRERLAQQLQGTRQGEQTEEPPKLRRFFPGVPETKPLTESQAEQIARQLQLAEGLLFTPKPDRSHLGAGCAYCHEVSRDGDVVKITPPAIPSRWLPHGRFKHDAHRHLHCIACHAEAPTSTQTADILLPAIATCQKCHQADTPQLGQASQTSAARASCVECHRYHLHSGELWDGKYALP